MNIKLIILIIILILTSLNTKPAHATLTTEHFATNTNACNNWENINNSLGSPDSLYATIVNKFPLCNFSGFSPFNIPTNSNINKIIVRIYNSGSGNTGNSSMTPAYNGKQSCIPPPFWPATIYNNIHEYIVTPTNCPNKFPTLEELNSPLISWQLYNAYLGISANLDAVSMQIDYTTSIPTPTPTPTPSASPTPAPFLNLPWNYDCNQSTDAELNKKCKDSGREKTFNDAAISINSYFDHSYPLLSSGLIEPADGSNNTLSFTNSFTYIGYSSHDGYDYGAPAGIKDGDPVLAAASGSATVVLAQNSHGAGNVIKIDHGNGYQTWYEHLYPDDLFVASESAHKEVQKGEKIGKVGHFGNCWVLDKNGEKIFNTPDCAHIHFSVFQDKEKTSTGEADFSDNIPSGVTDPYGWQPAKDLEPYSKNPDPWENYTFNQNDIAKKGNKSNYLWLTRIYLAAMPMSVDGGKIFLGPDEFFFPPGVYAENFNVYLTSSPFIKTNLNDIELKSIVPTIQAEARTLTQIIKTFLLPFTLTFDFTKASLFNIDPNTISIYSSENGKTWKKETTTIDDTNHKASASAQKFSYFALMGELIDTEAPITEANFSGTQGQDNWFRSDVSVSLSVTDNNLGVDYTYYKKQNEDWKKYSDTDPLVFNDEGNYEIQFYSVDKGGNIEDVQTISFSIDKTPPTISVTASPDTIWPPNGKMIDVKISGDSADNNDSVTTSFNVEDEYDSIEPDLNGFSQTIALEAKRNGSDLDGRTYTIQATAEDLAGNTAEANTIITVPHGQRK